MRVAASPAVSLRAGEETLRPDVCRRSRSLEALRPQKRVEQISREEDRQDDTRQIFEFHAISLQAVAGADVRPGDHEKSHGYGDEK